MATKINARLRHKRGTEGSIPTLVDGQLYLCTDTHRVYKGTSTGENILVSDIKKLNTISNDNLLINGAPSVWQRGTSFIDKQQFCADRWQYIYMSGDSSSGTIEKDFDGSMKLSRFNNYRNYIQQIIESKTLLSDKITLSVDIKGINSNSGCIFIGFIFSDNVDALADNSTNQMLIINASEISTSYKRFIFTADVPSTTKTIAVQIGSFYGHGSVINSDAIINIKNIKLENGDVATPFVHRPYGEELALCQRYYEVGEWSGKVVVADDISLGIDYKVKKRIRPTVKIYSYNDTENAVSKWGVNNVTYPVDAIMGSVDGIQSVTCQTSSILKGEVVIYKYVADAEIYN